VAVSNRVERLLQRLRFRDNPFGLREADREDLKRLASYFFEHPIFFDVLGSTDNLESVVLLAQRGAGKTTFRQAIQFYCRSEHQTVEDVLDVAYIDFTRPINIALDRRKEVDISLHVEEIIRCAVERLLEDLDEIRIRNYEALPGGQLATLKAYIDRYSQLLNPNDYGATIHMLLERIARHNQFQLGVDTSLLLSVSGEEIASQLPEFLQPIARWLVQLNRQPSRALANNSHQQLVREFLNLIVALKYKAMYVLVDRLDETSMLATPEQVVQFIRPLLTDLKLLDEDNLAFKFFLPQHLAEYIAGKLDFRSKRLSIRHLAWTEEDLYLLLARRLQSSTRANVSSMQIFCEPSLASRTVAFSSTHKNIRYVDAALVKSANNLPRDLILRCRKLFEAYEARGGSDLISEEDLDIAIAADLGSDNPPASIDYSSPRDVVLRDVRLEPANQSTEEEIPQVGLFIDQNGQVWRDGQTLPDTLTETEFKLLSYLQMHRHQILPRQQILDAVWGLGQATATLNATLTRLRQSVEYTPATPRFIITHHSRGIQLVDGL
jgi:hypothetical protein